MIQIKDKVECAAMNPILYKRKLKLKLHVETKAVSDAAAVNHDLYIKAHLQFQFRFQHLNL